MSQLPAPSAVEAAESGLPVRRSSAWPAVILLGLFWGVNIAARLLEMPYFFRFLFGMAAPLLLLIAFLIWWGFYRGISRLERAFGYLVVLAGAFVTAPLAHPSLGVPQALMSGVPLMITAWTLWILWAQRAGLSWRWAGSCAVVLMTWGVLCLVRIEGLDGDLKPSLHWRWTQTAEEKFLAGQQAMAGTVKPQPVLRAEVKLRAGDWPNFRGPQRDGVVRERIATDWEAHSPRQIWKERVGPAWSSVIIVGDFLFTQEQRGEHEAVVCYTADTGKQVWIHEDEARFWEAVSGAGPRGTPTFVEGKLYTLGATGVLNCLDAATGSKRWSHNLVRDASAVIPMWGLSSSPLVEDEVVVVYGGGANQNNLLAYDAESGTELWRAAAGGLSYASAEFATICGRPQVMILNDQGLMSVGLRRGEALWTAGQPMPGAPRCLQPHVLAGREIVIGSTVGIGLGRFTIKQARGQWTASEAWASPQMKAEFSEFVIHDGHAYGFDGAVFCCIDIESGKRNWKGGRYGRGQVILLADQALLLVLSETGEAVLVSASPEKHQEIARMQAVEGKTWNHPVIAHGRLYVRNAEEMACYQVSDVAQKPAR